ncbi:sigma 54-interacting transcriptional regulator [Thiohalobacter thiocyanaticus]|uniref:PAS domain S-box protein n=1 Tax=Thiohalobacter thiocyanaticus TaxID=585455 RepID=A0A426QHR3_9GAMM|nr:sigma 54-interacting transcriptional regulator [Thiohalobacter thiocyanaticus]RRQ21305.1 PAS domain S-box protein [Thiohalobacter thiocyanaticus]
MPAETDTLFNHLNEAALVIDPCGDRLLRANPEAHRLLDYPQGKLPAVRPSRLFMPDLAEMIAFTQAVMHRGQGWSNELHAHNRAGELVRLEISASLQPEAESPLMICTLRDHDRLEKLRRLTEANSLHREGLERWKSIELVFSEFERQNQLILNAAGEGIYGVDTEGRTTFANPAAERMLGWQAGDMTGRNIHALIHHSHADGGCYPAHECHIFAAFRDGKVRHVEDEVFWRKDGRAIPVEYTSTPILEEGRIVGAVVIFRDISERKQAEERLHAALDQVRTLKRRLELENAYLQEEYLAEHNYKEIVGRSPAIHKVIRQIELVAPTDAAVLITGESGTGKELVARAIHDSSDRHDRPMIRVNCASIPRELFESEFFGHIRGAFTGAMSDRAGRFELADGGTLFLDEVGEIPLELQGKLLRVLQEQQFERVGESVTRRVDVRIIAATNRDLQREVAEKRFREDLYFRLNVFPIESIPLRQRSEDIPLLAAHFLKLAGQKFGKPEVQLTHGDIERLQAYHWPGNIRELINVIERAVILARDGRLRLDIHTNDAPEPGARPPQPGGTTRIQTRDELRRQELDNIIVALRHCNGKVFGKGGAAELLEVKPTTLASRIKNLGIERHRFSAGQ